MGLKKYLAKRDLTQSLEPFSDKAHDDGSNSLTFCIQKHSARRLHYDFRLEYQGVLLSWAIPKEPSLNPHDKRLAIKVEDHPFEYQYFEGIIPKGNYGAGKVEIWDHGFYTVPHAKTKKESEKILSEGLKQGHFVINLDGERLQGQFIFQKINRDPEDLNWLFIKKEDAFAITEETMPKKKKIKKKS